MTTVQFIFVLLVVYQVKHFLADFPLQVNALWGRYMLGKFESGWGFLLPLTLHSAVHAWMTLTIVLVLARWVDPSFKSFAGLALFDFICHFMMDRMKAGPKYLGRFRDMTKSGYWNSLGLDQMVHHFTHYYVVYWLAAHFASLHA